MKVFGKFWVLFVFVNGNVDVVMVINDDLLILNVEFINVVFLVVEVNLK